MKKLTKIVPWSEAPRRNSRCDASNRANFDCLDCGVNTHDIREYYMVTDAVWDSVVKSQKGIVNYVELDSAGNIAKTIPVTAMISGMLCVGCLEIRLGRKLSHEDFIDALINTWPDVQRSRRLQLRMMA